MKTYKGVYENKKTGKHCYVDSLNKKTINISIIKIDKNKNTIVELLADKKILTIDNFKYFRFIGFYTKELI